MSTYRLHSLVAALIAYEYESQDSVRGNFIFKSVIIQGYVHMPSCTSVLMVRGKGMDTLMSLWNSSKVHLVVPHTD